MASKEFTDKFKKFKELLVKASDLFDELYLSSELKPSDLNENFIRIFSYLFDAITFTNRELKILEKEENE